MVSLPIKEDYVDIIRKELERVTGARVSISMFTDRPRLFDFILRLSERYKKDPRVVTDYIIKRIKESFYLDELKDLIGYITITMDTSEKYLDVSVVFKHKISISEFARAIFGVLPKDVYRYIMSDITTLFLEELRALVTNYKYPELRIKVQSGEIKAVPYLNEYYEYHVEVDLGKEGFHSKIVPYWHIYNYLKDLLSRHRPLEIYISAIHGRIPLVEVEASIGRYTL